ncbi:MAG: hypothetical protein ABR587_01265 [Candidatus Binatia bacterium]
MAGETQSEKTQSDIARPHEARSEVAQPGGRPPRRRRLLVVVAALVATAAALRFVLGFFAADLFAAAVRQAAARNGLEVFIDAPPEVTTSGFMARGVIVRSAEGQEWLRADTVAGSTRFFLRSPFLGISVALGGARANWPQADASAEAAALTLPVLPAVLSQVEFDDARIDLGEGRKITFDGAARMDGGGALIIHATRLEYSDRTGENAAEKMSGSLRLTSHVPGLIPKSAVASANAKPSSDALGATGLRFEVEAGSGAALIGSVLLDFAAHPLALAGVLESRKGGRLRVSGLALGFGKLVAASGSVDLARDGSVERADIVGSSDNLMPAFVTLVREPFAGVVPAFADAAVDGHARVSLYLGSRSRHSADATITLTAKSLRTRSVMSETLVVEFPWIGAALSGRKPRPGHLRAAKISLLGLPWTGVDTALTAEPGRLRATTNQEWKSAGGTLRISNLVLEDDARAGPRLTANLELVGFDLARLGEPFGIRWMNGSLGGNLGRVRLDADALRADGTVEMKTFGGTVRFSNLAIEQPFGRVPEFGLDAKVEGIDLGALTQEVGFGRVSGVLEGHVTGLVVAAGQAQSFDADLHTVSRRGVSQTVDVRAIVQLGVLGGGDRGSVTGALLRVVDRYRYSKLGLRCRLRNDVFEIRGVETDGDKDYIVKGSLLPPSVSVVSHSQVVSFSEMLRRVQRINTIEEGGSP